MSAPVYDAYRDTGVEWLGAVPSHWKVARLNALFREVSEPGSDGLPVLSVSIHSGVSDTELADDEMDRVVARSEDRSKYKRVEPNDLVYNMMRAWQGGFGAVQTVGSVSPAYVVARPTSSQSTRFVERLLRTPSAVGEMKRLSKGVTDFRLRLYWDEFKNIKVALPPLDEQIAIDAFLDREIGKIDALVEAQKRLIELLKEKRQAVISDAVTKGLDPAAPMKDSGVEWLGQIPAHWKMNRLKKVAKIRYGIGEPPPYQEVGTPLIRATNVDAGSIMAKGLVYVDPNDIPAKRIVWLQEGDIIVVRSGAYTGDSAIIRGKDVPSIAGFDMVVTADGCYPMFLQFSLLGRWVKAGQLDLEKMRAAQPHLNAEELGNVLLTVPPFAEQVEICERLARATSRLAAMSAEAEAAIELLKERRAALTSAAVTGKIDVRGLGPKQAEAA